MMDASIKLFIYQSDNLLVEVKDENWGADAFADDAWVEEYFSEEATKERAEAAKEEHDQIMSEW